MGDFTWFNDRYCHATNQPVEAAAERRLWQSMVIPPTPVFDNPDGFEDFSAGGGVRTPHELVCHLSNVPSYARSQLDGGTFSREPRPTWEEERERFRGVLADLSALLADGAEPRDVSLEALRGEPDRRGELRRRTNPPRRGGAVVGRWPEVLRRIRSRSKVEFDRPVAELIVP